VSLFFWLGREAEAIHHYLDDMMFFREEVERRLIECKPEADLKSA
jgi:hypothetical protein